MVHRTGDRSVLACVALRPGDDDDLEPGPLLRGPERLGDLIEREDVRDQGGDVDRPPLDETHGPSIGFVHPARKLQGQSLPAGHGGGEGRAVLGGDPDQDDGTSWPGGSDGGPNRIIVPGDLQLYAHDVVASITRPVAQLLGFQRVSLAPGEAVCVHFTVPTGRLAFSGRDMARVVEPGQIELWVGRSCIERAVESAVELVGPPT